MEKQPHVSVVIPVYNAEKYLEQCLQSLANQSMSDFEVICVDDGSTDASVEIIHEFMRRDERFSLIQQKNQYAGIARNNGLQHARGEYLLFLDADDFFHEELLAHTYHQAKKTKADVVLFGAQKYDMQTEEFTSAPFFFRDHLLPNKEVFSCRDLPEYFFQLTNSCPWLQLYRRQYIVEERITFQGLPNTNDAYFVLIALAAAKRVTAVKEELVYYRVNAGSSIQDNKYKNPTCFIEAYLSIYRELNRRGIYHLVEKTFACKVVLSCAHHLRTTKNREALQVIREAICSSEFQKMGVLKYPSEYYFDPAEALNVLAVPHLLKFQKWLKEEQHERLEEYRHSQVDKPDLTVIVPIVDHQKYLPMAIERLRKQFLESVEFLFVVESATLKEKEILKLAAEQDIRIAYCLMTGASIACARNTGLEYAQGRHVLFYQHRDGFADADTLDFLVKKMDEQELDVLCFGSRSLKETEENRNVKHDSDVVATRQICSGEQMLKVLYHAKPYLPSLELRVIRREYLQKEGIRFERSNRCASEYCFCFEALLKASRVGCLQETLYLRNLDEIWMKENAPSIERAYDLFRAYQEICRIIRTYSFALAAENEIQKLAKKVLSSSQETYLKLSHEERLAYRALEMHDRLCFEAAVSESASYQEAYAQAIKKLEKAYHPAEIIEKARKRVQLACEFVKMYGLRYALLCVRQRVEKRRRAKQEKTL